MNFSAMKSTQDKLLHALTILDRWMSRVMPQPFHEGKNRYIFMIACIVIVEMMVFGCLRSYPYSNWLAFGYVLAILILIGLAGRLVSVRSALYAGLLIGVMLSFC